MIDKHFLNNMICNLEQKKNLQMIEFTKDAVREILEYLNDLRDKDQRITELEEENKKLKEQLKNAFLPKYNIGQLIWFFHPELNHIISGRILTISIDVEERRIIYTIEYFFLNDELYLEETEIFSTKIEAQRYLEDKKNV